MFHVTERLLLRPAWPEDADALMRGIADEGVVRNLARAPWPYLPRHAREFVMRGQDARYPVFLITLPSAEGSKVIGCIGIDPCDSADAELGYWIARDHWGRGYASEAARGALEVARLLGYRRIEAAISPQSRVGPRAAQGWFPPTGRSSCKASSGRGRPHLRALPARSRRRSADAVRAA